MKHCIKSNKQ